MPFQGAFCRLVLGEPVPVEVEPGAGRVEAVAAAWRACAPELERRRTSLSWGEPAAGAGELARLPALPDLERAAVVAQALGLTPADIEQALDAVPADAFLARAHAALGDLGLPEDAECAAERARVAAAGGRGRHCAACEAFADAVVAQRAALRRAAVGVQRAAAPPRPPVLDRLIEPRPRLARVAVALVVVALGGGTGFGVVRAYEAPGRGDSIGEDGVVTATPVGPLPPGVGPTGP